MGYENKYTRRDLLAAMQMLEWANLQIYGVDLSVNKDQDQKLLKLLKLVKLRGHHWFRDMIADLAPAHAEGQRLGIQVAEIKDYQRSHDVIWTQVFMNACVDSIDVLPLILRLCARFLHSPTHLRK